KKDKRITRARQFLLTNCSLLKPVYSIRDSRSIRSKCIRWKKPTEIRQFDCNFVMKRKIVVDVDVGTDDYLALLYLLDVEKRGDLEILGIICTGGNAALDYVAVNVVRLLETLGRTDIPVYKGCKNQIILHKDTTLRYHGEDGLGDLEYDRSPDLSIIKDVPAAIGIHDIVKLAPNEVTMVCLGPLTNLALALKLYHELNSTIKEVWLMGGNYTGVGNVSCAAEFNFHYDPEAAYIVLENLKCPIYIFPWEACLVPEIPINWRFETLGNCTPELDVLTAAEKTLATKHNLEHWLPCDAFLAFCFAAPQRHITKSSSHHATVELHGESTRGQVVLDHLKKNVPNVVIIEDINRDLFMEEMLKLRK
ncbi:unnamed protein product, partial [Phyllotreta striolata]